MRQQTAEKPWTCFSASTCETVKNNQMPQVPNGNDVESQTLPKKEYHLKNPEPKRNSSQALRLGADYAYSLKAPRIVKPKPKKLRLTKQPNTKEMTKNPISQ